MRQPIQFCMIYGTANEKRDLEEYIVGDLENIQYLDRRKKYGTLALGPNIVSRSERDQKNYEESKFGTRWGLRAYSSSSTVINNSSQHIDFSEKDFQRIKIPEEVKATQNLWLRDKIGDYETKESIVIFRVPKEKLSFESRYCSLVASESETYYIYPEGTKTRLGYYSSEKYQEISDLIELHLDRKFYDLWASEKLREYLDAQKNA